MSSPTYPKAIDFLTKYSPAGHWCLTAIPVGGGRTATATFSASEAAACNEWLARHDADHNLYFLAAEPMAPLGSKATKEDIARARYLWCDVDPRAGEDLAAEQQRIRAFVTADQLPGRYRTRLPRRAWRWCSGAMKAWAKASSPMRS